MPPATPYANTRRNRPSRSRPTQDPLSLQHKAEPSQRHVLCSFHRLDHQEQDRVVNPRAAPRTNSADKEKAEVATSRRAKDNGGVLQVLSVKGPTLTGRMFESQPPFDRMAAIPRHAGSGAKALMMSRREQTLRLRLANLVAQHMQTPLRIRPLLETDTF
jgi:hypothetical protein